MTYKYKQAIIIRKDLKMRRGKEIAQGAHASLGAFLASPHSEEWFNEGQAKITLQVSSEEDLCLLCINAGLEGIHHYIVTDAGHTEFHGKPTITALAVGPDLVEKVDAITAVLALY